MINKIHLDQRKPQRSSFDSIRMRYWFLKGEETQQQRKERGVNQSWLSVICLKSSDSHFYLNVPEIVMVPIFSFILCNSFFSNQWEKSGRFFYKLMVSVWKFDSGKRNNLKIPGKRKKISSKNSCPCRIKKNVYRIFNDIVIYNSNE